MNTLGAPTLAEDSPEDVYDPDEVVPRNSPILSAHVPKLQPSPSRSPSVELREASPASSARSRKLSSRFKIKPSQGDAALVALLGGGSRPEIAIHAGREVLVHDTEDEDLGCSSSSAYSERSRSRTRSISPFRDASHQEEEEERWRRTNGGAGGGRDGSSSHSHSHSNSNSRRGSDHEAAACRAQGESSSSMTTTDSSRRPEAAGALDLKSLATSALAVGGLAKAEPAVVTAAGPTPPDTEHDVATLYERRQSAPVPSALSMRREARYPEQHRPGGGGGLTAVPSPYSPRSMYSPRDAPNPPLAAARQNTEQLASPPIPAQPAGARGELPPIQSGSSYVRSPGSETSGAQTQLPSIKAQFGDLRDLAAGSAAAVVESDRSGLHHAAFAHSPPGSLSRLPTMPLQHQHHAHHVSPPNSPADTFRHGLISPGGPPGSAFPANHYYIHPHHQLQQNGMHHPSLDYAAGSGDSSANRDHSVVSTPVTSVAYGMAAAAGGTSGPYICQFAGCNAPPFQTQYLLNSHANVHSSERPHYCPVEGCPRSKIGKGFKRKNEMIRHGLVHRSPGYVCPFCPDREHKYPRPDNLQRHVKVHHRDKNKDDPLLREVLSQRLDGPSRGRRRSRNLSG